NWAAAHSPEVEPPDDIGESPPLPKPPELWQAANITAKGAKKSKRIFPPYVTPYLYHDREFASQP
ncbi:hypothetical protein LZF95_26675, partial [Algoriphagus sp. AGSA1]|nr:hypothetical protein [Algoriphagus sp. AGSA1]